MQPFFSVIIPVYNCAHLVSETLDSLFIQTFQDFEIIVINDGSTDNTAEILKSYNESNKSNISIIYQDNKGEGGGRNSGIFAAKGKYAAFLDQDDIWFPWTLQIYHEVLEANDFPSILIASGQEFTSVESVSNIQREAVDVLSYEDFYSAASHGYLPAGTPGTVVRVEVAKKVNGLSEERVIGIDQEFFLKLGTAKGLVYVTSPITVAIRRHAGNLQKNAYMAAQGVLLFIEKELQQCYPGGDGLAWSRRIIISRLARSSSMSALQDGYFTESLQIYWQTLKWHLRLGRVCYLCIFPLLYLYRRFMISCKSTQGLS